MQHVDLTPADLAYRQVSRPKPPKKYSLLTSCSSISLKTCSAWANEFEHLIGLLSIQSHTLNGASACHQRLHHNDESTSSSVAHDAAQSNAVPHAESIHVEQAAKWWNALEPRNLRTSGRDDSRSRRHRKYAQLRQALLDAGVLEAGVPVNDAGLTAQST